MRDPGAESARVSIEIVFICTGNRARSPFAAALLRRHLSGLPAIVTSRGTHDLQGAPALGSAVRVARSFGIELGEHRSRPLVRDELRGADLVVGFEPFHVATAVVDGGALNARAFLLTELANALDEVAPSRGMDVALLLEVSDGHRRATGLPVRRIGDPVRGSDELMLRTFMEIDDLVARVALRLIGSVTDRTG
jgi:protein-tyrosine phosphatase